MHTLRLPITKSLVQLVNDLIEAFRWHLFTLGIEEIDLNAPTSEGHFFGGIATNYLKCISLLSLNCSKHISYTTLCLVISLIERLTYEISVSLRIIEQCKPNRITTKR